MSNIKSVICLFGGTSHDRSEAIQLEFFRAMHTNHQRSILSEIILRRPRMSHSLERRGLVWEGFSRGEYSLVTNPEQKNSLGLIAFRNNHVRSASHVHSLVFRGRKSDILDTVEDIPKTIFINGYREGDVGVRAHTARLLFKTCDTLVSTYHTREIAESSLKGLSSDVHISFRRVGDDCDGVYKSVDFWSGPYML